MAPQLEARVQAKQIPLRKVDIVKWGSPVSTQYSIQSIPALWLYKDGKLVSKDSQQVFDHLNS
ncbi:MAG: thioredoxin domain-containing protein [Candidatus Eisenbacteria bacterium]